MRIGVLPEKNRQAPRVDGMIPRIRANQEPQENIAHTQTREFSATIFSRGRRSRVTVFAEDAFLYPTHALAVLGERPLSSCSIRTVDGLRKFGYSAPSTPLTRKIVFAQPTKEMAASVEAYFLGLGNNIASGLSGFRLGLSPARAAYIPLVGAMTLGVVSALFLEHSFGGRVQAEEARIVYVERPVSDTKGADISEESTKNLDTEAILSDLGIEDPNKKEFENRVRTMVKGYPIESMIPEILEQDRSVAMFLIAIAKKESNWGRRVPVLEGQDCFNYWGYRGIRKMMGTGGHTCFNSRKDAVATVGKRLDTLIKKYDLTTPADLILWKCGSSCAAHSSESVRKWIADVDLYYKKLNLEGVE